MTRLKGGLLSKNRLWYDDLPADARWSALWRGYIICGCCSGIRRVGEACSVCGDPWSTPSKQLITLDDGQVLEVPAAFMGAEGRYEDWIYLQLLEREWKRPVQYSDRLAGFPEGSPSPRAAIVLIFWTYFETRIERLLRAGLRNVPSPITEDALRRYSFVGARLQRFYEIVFGSTYFKDLKTLGFAKIATHLASVQKKRNDFVHGKPQAIDDTLVHKVVRELKTEHEAWIAVFNKCCTVRSSTTLSSKPTRRKRRVP